jgi:hypothetical protein
VSEVSPGILKFKFQRLLKKKLLAPNQTTLWSSLYSSFLWHGGLKIVTAALTILAEFSRPWKDHFKSDLRSDQDHLLKKDLRSDQDHIF